MTQPALLAVEHLSTSFDTARGPLRAVDDVSFTLHRGETFGIVGESGSGKSALVRTIMGLQPRSAMVPPESKLLFEGTDIRSMSPEKKRHLWGPQIAMIFQDPMTSLNPVRTIRSQMVAPMRYHLGVSRREADARAADLLAQVGISASSARICACTVTSSAVVGSSAINRSGSLARAIAIMTRCRWPPDNWCG